MDWRMLLISVAGVLGLAGLARLLGLGGGRIEDHAAAAREAEAAFTGFQAVRIFLTTDHQAALVSDGEGVFVLLKVHGVHVAARRLAPSFCLRASGDVLILETGERMFGPVPLRLTQEDRDALRAVA